jgi:hypothetical protein
MQLVPWRSPGNDTREALPTLSVASVQVQDRSQATLMPSPERLAKGCKR